MNRTKRESNNAKPGFAIPISETTELESGMLIIERDAASYVPLAAVATVSEARQLAQDDLHRRIRQLEQGHDMFYPVIYKVWARGLEGPYAVAAEFDSSIL